MKALAQMFPADLKDKTEKLLTLCHNLVDHNVNYYQHNERRECNELLSTLADIL